MVATLKSRHTWRSEKKLLASNRAASSAPSHGHRRWSKIGGGASDGTAPLLLAGVHGDKSAHGSDARTIIAVIENALSDAYSRLAKRQPKAQQCIPVASREVVASSDKPAALLESLRAALFRLLVAVPGSRVAWHNIDLGIECEHGLSLARYSERIGAPARG